MRGGFHDGHSCICKIYVMLHKFMYTLYVSGVKNETSLEERKLMENHGDYRWLKSRNGIEGRKAMEGLDHVTSSGQKKG